jgi:Tol biopolymer transport system component
VDGGAEVQVITDTAPFISRGYRDISPAWSPDGEEIAFLSDRTTPISPLPSWHLFITSVAGSLARQLSPIRAAAFRWAPDGRRIAYVEGVGPSTYGNILVLDLDTGSSTRVGAQQDVDADPVWSPDGVRLAFTSVRDGNDELYVMSADGSGERRLTTNAAADNSAAWSPDGSRLAFQTDRDGNWEIYAIAVDGTGLTNLTQSPAQETAPAWR